MKTTDRLKAIIKNDISEYEKEHNITIIDYLLNFYDGSLTIEFRGIDKNGYKIDDMIRVN